jgi:predicted GNAT family acetyltransferase
MGESADGEFRVQDNPVEGRYEALVGDDLAGFVTYDKVGDQIVFTHTLVEPAFEGKGIGGRLASAALDDVREHGSTVIAECPFIAEYIQRHPAYADLLAPGTPA